jgi:hypothetical protein
MTDFGEFPPKRGSNLAIPPLSERLTTQAAAEYLNLSPATLRNWRNQRRGPAFFQLSRTRIFYAKGDLDEWLRNRRVRPLCT